MTRHQVSDKPAERGAILVGERGPAKTTLDEVADAGFLSAQPRRRTFESVFARLVATAGIVGVGTVVGAIVVAAGVAGWITGLAVSTVTVSLAAMLWRSRRL